MKPIINIADAPVGQTLSHGEAFAATTSPLASKVGGNLIGANVTRVPPGKAAFPFHHHYANEEHFFIVSGTGTLRLGDTVHPVRAGDYIVTPPGGPELAHQLINTGADELVYLSLSTRIAPEVVGYPDSGKIMMTTALFPQPGFRALVETNNLDTVGYWDGEDGATVSAIARGDRDD